MAERTVKHGLFSYWEKTQTISGTGEKSEAFVERIAFHGQTIELSDEEAERGDSIGAFYTQEEIDAAQNNVSDSDEGEEIEIDVAEATAEEIAEFIKAASLNAQETVDLATDEDGNADAALALKVHEAELIAQGGEGRVTVTKALEAIVSRA